MNNDFCAYFYDELFKGRTILRKNKIILRNYWWIEESELVDKQQFDNLIYFKFSYA